MEWLHCVVGWLYTMYTLPTANSLVFLLNEQQSQWFVLSNTLDGNLQNSYCQDSRCHPASCLISYDFNGIMWPILMVKIEVLKWITKIVSTYKISLLGQTSLFLLWKNTFGF